MSEACTAYVCPKRRRAIPEPCLTTAIPGTNRAAPNAQANNVETRPVKLRRSARRNESLRIGHADVERPQFGRRSHHVGTGRRASLFVPNDIEQATWPTWASDGKYRKMPATQRLPSTLHNYQQCPSKSKTYPIAYARKRLGRRQPNGTSDNRAHVHARRALIETHNGGHSHHLSQH
jgi:hypothetical protein